jgi:hypothetical protein
MATLTEWQEFVRSRIIDNEKKRITPRILREVLEQMGVMLFESIITTQVFNTVADLMAVDSASTAWMYATRGQLSVFDGNGHIYVWKSDESTAHDGINYIAPTFVGAGSGRFVIFS